eukprot:184510-Pelagomonas_calceolata.AAC.3
MPIRADGGCWAGAASPKAGPDAGADVGMASPVISCPTDAARLKGGCKPGDRWRSCPAPDVRGCCCCCLSSNQLTAVFGAGAEGAPAAARPLPDSDPSMLPCRLLTILGSCMAVGGACALETAISASIFCTGV